MKNDRIWSNENPVKKATITIMMSTIYFGSIVGIFATKFKKNMKKFVKPRAQIINDSNHLK